MLLFAGRQSGMGAHARWLKFARFMHVKYSLTIAWLEFRDGGGSCPKTKAKLEDLERITSSSQVTVNGRVFG